MESFSPQINKWKTILSSLTKPKMAFMTLLGFCSGVPLFLVFSTLSAWLREEGVSRTEIGYFIWVGFAYSLKFLWAPCVDRLPAFGFEKWIGRRKGWMLWSQIGVVIGVLGMSFSQPGNFLSLTAIAAIFTAFWGATQDVSVDAWRIEIGGEEEQGLLATVYQLGYRIAYYVAVAFAFFLADLWSWERAYLFIGVIFLASAVLTAFFAPRPSQEPDEIRNSGALSNKEVRTLTLRSISKLLIRSVAAPFGSFFRRYGLFAILALLLISSYRITDFVMGSMANPFYIDLGFSKTQIAASIKMFGPFFTLIGAVSAGVGMFRFGMRPLLILGAITGALSNLTYAWVAFEAERSGGIPLYYLMGALAVENFSGGLAGTVLIAFMSSLVERRFAATQYALFSSLYAFSGKIIGGFSGVMVDHFAKASRIFHTDSVIASFSSDSVSRFLAKPPFMVSYSSEGLSKLSGYAPFFVVSSMIGILAIFLAVLWFFLAPELKTEEPDSKIEQES